MHTFSILSINSFFVTDSSSNLSFVISFSVISSVMYTPAGDPKAMYARWLWDCALLHQERWSSVSAIFILVVGFFGSLDSYLYSMNIYPEGPE